MKKILIITALILMATASLGNGVKMIGRDFWVDDKDIKPFSVGVCSWTDKDDPCTLAAYGSCSLLAFWDNHLRLGVGLTVTDSDPDSISAIDLRWTTSITTLLWKHLEVGFYAAPFYNISDHTDDPYGFMIGYAFGF